MMRKSMTMEDHIAAATAIRGIRDHATSLLRICNGRVPAPLIDRIAKEANAMGRVGRIKSDLENLGFKQFGDGFSCGIYYGDGK